MAIALQQPSSMTGTQQELLRIPLSMSQPRADTDRHGQPCLVLDAIINDSVLALAMRTTPLKSFVTNLIIAWANEKVYHCVVGAVKL